MKKEMIKPKSREEKHVGKMHYLCAKRLGKRQSGRKVAKQASKQASRIAFGQASGFKNFKTSSLGLGKKSKTTCFKCQQTCTHMH